ncbi:MAG: aspartate 1-decarboxylase [Phycisphaerales bacterium]|nr:MAG: aspartate 1-decarboxylase [Phycisphaerales bacterium]
MLRKVLFAKIHLATVTAACPDYVGSITIDLDILDATGIRVSDAVLVANHRNAARFETYVFPGERGSGKIEVNGAAAHLVEKGDRVIIFHYAHMTDEEYWAHRPPVALMTPDNRVQDVIHYEPGPHPERDR